VVQVLTELGVTVVSEDPETYDIHADIVGGWPKIVEPVLNYAKSLSYDPENFPGELRSKVDQALRLLVNQAAQDAHKPTSYKLAVGGALKVPENRRAKNVIYAFKAPVAMTLVPWWNRIIPHFRFLHVVRDGRDIAFSANQGPVLKFYHSMFGLDRNVPDPTVRAIKLWSAWNSEIYKWSNSKETLIHDPKNVNSFHYHVLKSEDLVDEDLSTRFNAIRSLAIWVGSNLDDRQICCVAAEGVGDVSDYLI
jgi:hypothetical protein